MAIDAKDVIGWVGSGAAGAVAGLLVPAYAGWAAPWAVVLFLWFACFLVLGWAAWSLRQWWRAATVPMPLRLRSWRFAAAVAWAAFAILVIAPVGWGTGYAWWANGTLLLPRVAIEARPATLRTTDTAHLTAMLDDRPADAVCTWSLGGMRRSPDCQLLWRPPPGSSGAMRLTVDVRSAAGWQIGSAERRIVVTYQGVAAVTPRDSAGFVGDSMAWTAALDGHPVGPPQTCQWSIDDQRVLDGTPSCEVHYVAQDGDVGAHRITARVMDGAGTTIASGTTQFRIRQTEPVYFEYVLDASARMDRPARPDGTLLRLVIRNLIDELGRMAGGFVGVELAADRQGAVAADACRNVRELWPLQPLNPLRDALRQALQSVEAGSSLSVPLNEAVAAAFLALARNAPDPAISVLTILAAGPDSCAADRRNLSEVLGQLESANPSVHLRARFYDYRLLALTVGIAFTEGDQRQWQQHADAFRIGDAATAVVLARDAEQLRSIQADIAQLSARRHAERLAACRRLIRFADERTASALGNFCRQLR